MKKIIALLLAVVMVLSLAACSGNSEKAENTDTPAAETTDKAETTGNSDFKVGVVLVGDENEGYTYAHIAGIKEAMKNCNVSEDQVKWFYNVPEDETCYDKCIQCVAAGCKLIITNSYGHQSHAQLAASENPDVQFVSMTGDTAYKSGLANFKNAFNQTYQSRYVSGVVAGLKIKQLVEEGKLTDKNYDADGNVKVGYVGAYPYAEVISGFTGFFLGIKSVYEKVVMDVTYTNSWFSYSDESQAADMLMSRGCVIIGQHADSGGAPSACEAALKAGTVVYSVGYNVDMLNVAPNAALTSSSNNWGVYYTHAFKKAIAGEQIETDWSKGYDEDAVCITPLGPSCAPGTKEAVDTIEAAIKAGTLHVFDINTFTVGGQKVTSALCFDSDGDFVYDQQEAIKDGYYHESEFISAPSFNMIIDGITTLN